MLKSNRLPLLLGSLLLAVTVTAPAADIVWTNAASGNWATAANWSPNTVPGAADVAFLTNSGTYTVTVNTTLTVGSVTVGSTSAAGIQTLANSGTLTVTNTYLETNAVILLNAGTLITAGPATLLGKVNQAGGTWQLNVATTVSSLNQTNGDVQGRNLTVTNWNWYAGNHYRGTPGLNTNDDRTIIPPGGVMNLLTTATRYFTYYSATGPARTLDNYGTINWTGNALFYSYGVFNNYGTVNVTAVGTPQYLAVNANLPPTFNNYGTFTRSAGTFFYFQNAYVNNFGLMDSQQGTLSIYTSTFNNNGSVNVANGSTFQSFGSTCTNTAGITLDATSSFTVDNSGTFTFETNSSLVVPGYNRIVLNAGNVFLRTTNITTPSVWVAGAGLYLQTNNTFATINMSAGGIELGVPITLGLLNQTNGNIQGRNLTVTNWNWYAGNHYRGTPGVNTNDDRTIIPAGGVMNLLTTATRYFTYYSATGPSRTLDNFGTINWSGNALFYSYGLFNNYGSVNVTAVGTPQYLAANANLPPTFNNYGTFTRSAGTFFYFQNAYVNNLGLMDAQQGTLSIYTSTFNNGGTVNVANGSTFQAFGSTCTNTTAITLDAASYFTVDNSGTFTFETNSSLVVPTYNHLVLNAGSVFLRTTNITTPSVWVAGAGLYFQTNNTFATINLSGGGIELGVPITLNQLNQTNGNIQGRNLTVTNWNWLAGYHFRGTPGDNSFDDRTIIPVGGVMNLLTTATRYLTYYSATGPSRTLDNYGTINWSGNALLYSYGLFNNYGSVNATAVGTPQYLAANANLPPTFNNYGSFTRLAGTVFYFVSSYVNNYGLMDIQAGTVSIYNSTMTNYANLNLAAGGVFQSEVSSVTTFAAAGQIVAPTTDSIRLGGASAYLQSTNILSPSLWLQAGTVYQQTNIVIAQLNLSGANLELSVPAVLNQLNQTNGWVQGRTLTVTNWNWYAGHHVRGVPTLNDQDDRTIIPVGGTMNLLGTAARNLTYYTGTGPSRTLDNFGTVNWSGNALLYSYGFFNNYGLVNVTAVGTPEYIVASASLPPTFNNYGTFNRTNGTVFYFQGAYVNNLGTMNAQAGILSIYNSTFTNSASLNVGAAGVFQSEVSSVVALNSGSQIIAPTLDSIRFGGASTYLETTNILSPGLWQQAGTLYQRTNIVVAKLDMSGGALQLDLPANLNQLNQTNGDVQGRTLTVTNWNWFAGYHYRGTPGGNTNDDRTIIPLGGSMNLLGTATRYLSYFVAPATGRPLDNFGTINWTGAAILGSYGTINNYGSVNVSAIGAPQFYSPSLTAVWNNYGNFTRSAGTLFYFQGGYLNNSGLMDVQQGIVSIYNATFTNSTGQINVGAAGVFQSEASSVVALNSGSQITAPTLDSIRLGGASAYLETTNILSPSVWQQAGTLFQRTNIVVAKLNMSGGALQLDVPATLNQLNQTNGDVQGRSLTVTNWNWFAGHHYRGIPGNNSFDDRTIIPVGGTMNLLGAATRNFSYFTAPSTGRTLDNYGTINWSGAAVLGSYGLVNNYGSVNVSAVGAPQFYSPSLTAVWNNYGTFTRSAGTLFYFQGGYLNNSGLLDLQQGTVSIYNATFTNSTGQLNVGAAAIFQSEVSSVVALNSGSQIIAPTLDSVRFGGASTYLETTNILSPGLWQQAGTLYQRTNIVVAKIDMSGGVLQLDLPANLNQLNQTNGDVQGRTLTVTNWNWFAGFHYRGTPSGNTNDDRTIIPVGGTMNLLGTATRYLSYYVAPTTGRTLDNYGTVNWSGSAVLGSYGMINNYGSVNVSAVGAPQFYSPSLTAVWNNYGTYTRSAGTLFYFQGGYVNNSGLMDVQQGTLSIYNSTFTNLASGSVTIGASGLLLNEASAISVLNPGSSITSTAPNAFQIPSGSVYARSVNLSLPSLLISGGTLNQDTNVVVPVINESAGTWQLNLPVAATTYNLTNGDLRGANLALNNFNWLGGALYATGAASNTVTVASALNISGNTAKTLTYLTTQPGRNLINNGIATWSGASITGQGGATFLNNGTLTVTNDTSLAWGGSGATPALVNVGTFTKSGGSGVASYSSTAITNGGTFNYNSGSLAVGGMFVQTNGNSFLGTNFTASSNVRIEAGTLTGKGSVAGYVYNNGIFNPGASPGWVSAASYTNTAAATFRVELGGVGLAGTNYDQVRLAGPNSLNGTIDIALVSGFIPSAGNQFTVMVHTARSGIFTFTNSTVYDFTILYTPSNVVLRAENAKPALTVNVGTTQMVCQPFTFSAIGNDVDGAVTNIQFFFNGTPVGSFTNAALINPYTAKSKMSYDFPGLSTLTATGTDERGGVTTTNISIQFITGSVEMLTLGGFAPTTNRSFEVCMLGQLGTNYVLLANTNLTTTNWVNLGPMENTNGIWRYFDTAATNLPLRFYRAQQVP